MFESSFESGESNKLPAQLKVAYYVYAAWAALGIVNTSWNNNLPQPDEAGIDLACLCWGLRWQSQSSAAFGCLTLHFERQSRERESRREGGRER